jgi:hypothetical protein
MQISLPAGYSIAQASTPLLAPGARAYGIATPHGLDPPLLVALWVYSPAAVGSATTTLQNVLKEDEGRLFSAAAPLVPRMVGERKAWQRQLSRCPLNDVSAERLLYIELADGSIVRLAVSGFSGSTTPSVQRSAFEAIAASISFDTN